MPHLRWADAESSLSLPTASTSTKYPNTSGWMQSHRASPRHAGRRCGMAPMCKPVRALSQPQTGMKRPNRRRTLRSISASVGKQWRQRFCQCCGAGLRPSPPQTDHADKSRSVGPEQALRQTSACRPVMPKTWAIIVLMRLDFLSVWALLSAPEHRWSPPRADRRA